MKWQGHAKLGDNDKESIFLYRFVESKWVEIRKLYLKQGVSLLSGGYKTKWTHNKKVGDNLSQQGWYYNTSLSKAQILRKYKC